jgi:hypothetical protein
MFLYTVCTANPIPTSALLFLQHLLLPISSQDPFVNKTHFNRFETSLAKLTGEFYLIQTGVLPPLLQAAPMEWPD